MTTVTKFFTDTINGKVFYHIRLADIDNRGNMVTVTVSKKEFEHAIDAFQLSKAQAEKTNSGEVQIYF